MTTEVAAPTCEARSGFYPGEWSEMPVFCQATTALTTWTDRSGFTHRACRHHVGALRKRYPEMEQMEPPRVASPHCESGGHPGCTCDVCF